MFDGRIVEKYFATDHAQLHNSAIVDVVCDERNRVWVLIKKFKIIFTTAYNVYVIQAIRFSAFDYLLKPINNQDQQLSVHRFLETQEDYRQQFDLLKNIMHKSHLVNKKFISFIDHEGFAVLKDNRRVEVSRRRKEEVMAALK